VGVDLPGIVVQARAYWATVAERFRHARVSARHHRHVLTSAFLVVLGLGGALAGGALVGEWALGVVLIAESGFAVFVGLKRDDRKPQVRGRTVGEVLEQVRARPW
jgi:hypothetical protein